MGVVLYVRQDCPLCDEASAALKRFSVDFDEVDITGNEELESVHGRFVPVVEVDGSEVFSGGMDPAALAELRH
jgi:glutaredoxin